MHEKKSILRERSFQFALKCIDIYKKLTEARKEYVMSKQLLRSGTSVGASIREAKNAESKADFIHKLAIAQKECDESIYWLELLFESKYIDNHEFAQITEEANGILKMLKSSIITMKNKK